MSIPKVKPNLSKSGFNADDIQLPGSSQMDARSRMKEMLSSNGSRTQLNKL